MNSRCLKILEIVKRDKKTTLEKIADELNVSIRTIRTDMECLRKIIPQVVAIRGRHGGGIAYEEELSNMEYKEKINKVNNLRALLIKELEKLDKKVRNTEIPSEVQVNQTILELEILRKAIIWEN